LEFVGATRPSGRPIRLLDQKIEPHKNHGIFMWFYHFDNFDNMVIDKLKDLFCILTKNLLHLLTNFY